MYGYTGKSLRVDLTKGSLEILDTPATLITSFIGGRGIAVARIGKSIVRHWDDPEMPLLFSSGPLVGTEVPTSGRSSVASRSPLTGTICDCSVGGNFGTELKRAGFDFIEITGRSDRWTILRIEDGLAQIEDGSSLAGKNVSETRKGIGTAGSDAVIGIAGERGVLYASIVFDGHYLAGRGGLGAVMGAKRLKAITLKGGNPVAVADPEGLRTSREEIMRLLRASQAIFGELGLSEFGTAALVDLIHARRMEPTDNFRRTFYPSASSYSGYRLKTAYNTRKTGCRGCPVLCKKLGRNGEVIPEFETASHFGALNCNADVAAIVEANRLCNEYGLDTISTASTIACHREITGAAADAETMLSLIHSIGERKDGIGAHLALGSYRYAEQSQAADASMSVKKLELPAYDPRGAYGMALAYATSNRGGCHLRAYPISHEILRKPVSTDRFSFDGKARIIKIAEDMNAVIDSLSACKFVFFAATLEEYAGAFTAVTGMPCTPQSLLAYGERIYVLERLLNSLNGFSSDDDELPARFFTEPGTSSPRVMIEPLNRDDFLNTRSRYYRIRGYDDRGIPTPDLINRLNLVEYA